MNINLKSYLQDFFALSFYMRNKLSVKIIHVNPLKQDDQPDTAGLLLKIQWLL